MQPPQISLATISKNLIYEQFSVLLGLLTSPLFMPKT